MNKSIKNEIYDKEEITQEALVDVKCEDSTDFNPDSPAAVRSVTTVPETFGIYNLLSPRLPIIAITRQTLSDAEKRQLNSKYGCSHDITFKYEQEDMFKCEHTMLIDMKIKTEQGIEDVKEEPSEICSKCNKVLQFDTNNDHVEYQDNDNVIEDINEIEGGPSIPSSNTKVKKCPKCTFIYTNERSILLHGTVHVEGTPPYTCTECHFITATAYNFNVHIIRYHTKDKPALCPYCDSCYTTSSELHRHIKSCHPRLVIQCDQCEYSAAVASTINKHKLNSHPKCGIIPVSKCAVCPFVYTNPESLKLHLIVHISDLPYQCQQCEYNTHFSPHFNRHILTHTRDKPHSCTGCYIRFAQINSLRRHIKLHHPDSPLICAKCDYIGCSTTMFNEHMDKAHSKKLKIAVQKCEKCVFIYKNPDSLQLHQLVHTSNPPYHCQQCDYSTPLTANFNRHIRTHTQDKPHSCAHCDCWFGNTSTVKRHIQHRHRE